MTDAELREMVRASIAKLDAIAPPPLEQRQPSAHASFARLQLHSGDGDGACLIEPTVRCTHCGFCVSYGH